MVEYVAIDCEMVKTTGSQNDLARVTLVDEHLQVLLDEYIRPKCRVLDYRTPYSGITAAIIREKGKGKCR